MKTKYKCPQCGNVPLILSSKYSTYFTCCEVTISHKYFFIVVMRWKKYCKMVDKTTNQEKTNNEN